MPFSVDYIEELLTTSNGVEIIDIYPRHIGVPGDSHSIFRTMKGDNLVDQLSHFKNNCPGKWTFFLHTGQNRNLKTAQKILVSNGESTEQSQTMNGEVNMEEFRKSIIAEMEEKSKAEKLEAELKETKRLLRESRKPGEKLAYLIDKVVERLDKRAKNVTMQGTDYGDMDDLEASQIEALEAAFKTLYRHLGEETILIVADKLDKDPSLADTIKNFLT